MGTTSDKLSYLATTKDKLKTAINYTGANITNDTFRSYPRKLYDAYLDIINNGISNLISNIPKVQQTGTYLDLTNTAEAPLIDFKMYGDTQQDSTTGKNLFNTTMEQNAWDFNTGGTYTSSNYIRTKDKISVVSGQTYTLSFKGKQPTSDSSGFVFYTNGTYYGSLKQVSTTFTVPNGANQVVYNLGVSGGVSPSDIYDIQLELGSTATQYEQYTGGQSAPSPTYPFDIHNVSGDNTIEIFGKNLFDKSTMTLNSAIDAANGSMTSSANFVSIYVNCEPNTKYTIQKIVSNRFVVGFATDYDLTLPKHLNNHVAPGTSLTSYTFTTPNNAKRVFITISKTSDDTTPIQNILDSIMIEKGETASEYEAYTGNSQLISLGVENILNPNIFENRIINCYSVSADGTITQSETDTNYWNDTYIPNSITLNKGTYTISVSNRNNGKLQVYNMTTGSSIVEQKVDSYTFTLNNDNQKINVKIYGSDSYPFNFKIQLEKGSKANSYTPYGTTPIELNKISTYQDYIYKDNDRWFLHKEIDKKVITGNDITAINTNQTNTTRAKTNNNFISALVEGIGYSNYFKLVSNWGNDNVGIYFSSTNGDVWFRASKSLIGTTLGDVQTWVNGHNIELIYVLATPTDTEITTDNYPMLLEQLNNLKQIKSKNHQTNINQENNDLPFIITASAIKEYE